MDEELREKAQLSFRDIKHAYEVLSNEGTRIIYDKYGSEAVDLYVNMQLESDGKKSHQDVSKDSHPLSTDGTYANPL